ncbi:toll/interleukin-1 receptor domain-containing protein [Yersinia enterocolitica]|nr:toll/interleukin-1 receptor domain-containing protein [Yersinia enterocolitica]EKN6029616.1 toll/interleukin-1 receptor domain-containing protein [Yersinia enterocolitica]ELW8241151.1 toll/interleukin-1 receptor domain-containing protein [Yersinia enterocolitica]
MTIKVFISYSHKDEEFKESLVEHLSALKRNSTINSWDDRKILAGQDWKNEISENLKESEIILFLISPSFIASDYCMNIEFLTAIQMHDDGCAILIPIIVRPSDLESTQFSSFQAVPKDAIPVITWTHQDEAWVDVIRSIKKSIIEIENIKKKATLN